MIIAILLIIAFAGALLSFQSKNPAKTATTTSFAMLLYSAISVWFFDLSFSGFQFTERQQWITIGDLELSWFVGVDGMSYSLVLLSAFLCFVSVLISKREIHSKENVYYGTLLAMVGAVIGVFVSLDLVLFFAFWEVVLVLIFILVLIWGHSNRKYAAMKLLVYTGIGSLALLLAIIALSTAGTVAIPELLSAQFSTGVAYLIFGLLLFGFFVKIPIVPFHTWLPDAHTEAPTAGSMLLAGLLLKMGGYGLIRLGVGILPEVTMQFSLLLFILGTVTLIYGAFVCLVQTHLKRLVAYSSINHMGFVLIGIAAGSTLGIQGAVFEMVSHGILAALLFALVGLVHERTGTFELASLKGLVQRMPKTSWLIVIAALASMGLPTLSGFIAEFIVLMAAFQAFGLLGLIPVAGVIITGGYFVRVLTKGVFGTGRARANEDNVSFAPFVAMLVASVILGILPFLLLEVIA